MTHDDDGMLTASYELTTQLMYVVESYAYLHPELENVYEGIMYTALVSMLSDTIALSTITRIQDTNDRVEDVKKIVIDHVVDALNGGVDLILSAQQQGAQGENVVQFKPKGKK